MLLFLILLIFIFSVFTGLIVMKIQSLKFMKKINNRALFWIISFVPNLLILILMRGSIINSAIVTAYLMVIWVLSKLSAMLIKKATKFEINETIICVFAAFITTIYLCNAYYLAHHVVATHYEINTKKDIGVDNFRVIQISDSHIGSTMNGDKFIKYMEDINEENPDIVVVTGDFIDDDTLKEDMIKGCVGLGKLKTKYGVYFVYGNHDKGYFTYRGYTYELLDQELEKNNVTILRDEIYPITDNIYLIGRKDKSEERKDIGELVKGIDKSKYLIDLNHQPNDYKNEAKAGVDLVLAGHTHGGQFFPLGQLGVIFGPNDSYYGLKQIDNTNFIVNSGIGDWSIWFKTGTVAEYGVIDIKHV